MREVLQSNGYLLYLTQAMVLLAWSEMVPVCHLHRWALATVSILLDCPNACQSPLNQSCLGEKTQSLIKESLLLWGSCCGTPWLEELSVPNISWRYQSVFLPGVPSHRKHGGCCQCLSLQESSCSVCPSVNFTPSAVWFLPPCLWLRLTIAQPFWMGQCEWSCNSEGFIHKFFMWIQIQAFNSSLFCSVHLEDDILANRDITGHSACVCICMFSVVH